MNTSLVDYGIHNEESDVRAHVCKTVGIVYVFPTQAAVQVIETGNYKKYPAYTEVNGQRIKTAEGYLVPPEDIPECKAIKPGLEIWSRADLHRYQSTTEKGNAAMWIVSELLKRGLFPLQVDPSVVYEADIQREGVDLIVALGTRIQVKCDYGGGPKELGGTGNLYLQIAECNPLKAH